VMERKRATGERMDALIRGPVLAQSGTNGTEMGDPVSIAVNEKAPATGLF